MRYKQVFNAATVEESGDSGRLQSLRDADNASLEFCSIAFGATNRQIRAYCKLLNIRGKPNDLHAKLHDYVSKKGGTVAWPSSPRQSNPPGDTWVSTS